MVRDKKGRPVRDLKPEDIQITDEGAPQKIRGFRLVDGAAPSEPEGPAASDRIRQLDPNHQIRLVTLVFDKLGNEARHMSKQAAMDLINAGQEQNLYYSVFSIDQRLSILQQFTNDKALLKHAVERATSGAYSSFPSLSDEIKKTLEQQSKVSTSAGTGRQFEQPWATTPPRPPWRRCRSTCSISRRPPLGSSRAARRSSRYSGW